MEQQEARKSIDWFKVVFVIENLLILLLLVRGCWWYLTESDLDLSPSINYHVHIHSYPDKLIYVIGQDTELDLTGGQVCFSVYRRDLCGFPCEAQPEDAKENPDLNMPLCESIQDMAKYAPSSEDLALRIHDLNLKKPGVYHVVLTGGWGLECSFPIQVVDREYLE